MCLNWGLVEKLLNRNPFARYPRPKTNPRPKLITAAGRAKLITARDEGNKGQRRAASFKPLLSALVHGGPRGSRICNLDPKDVSCGTRIIGSKKYNRR